MAGRLEGKVAIVTGGCSGIGKRTAELFVEEGARVFIGDVNADGIGEMARQLGHNQCDGLEVDIRNEEQVQKMVEGAVRRFGRLDIAFNNAGVGGFSPIQDYPLAEFQRVVDICLTGTFLCIKHESKYLIGAGKGGSIVNIASLNAMQATEGFAAYCSAKAGVAMLTKVAALELGRHNIRVNAIGPGLIHTPATEGFKLRPGVYEGFIENSPMGRAGEPEDVDGGQSLKKYPELFGAFGVQ
jgi:NAD(P)-dependent dehydrogenase (short-subunit alcohol dehydrogenase family)